MNDTQERLVSSPFTIDVPQPVLDDLADRLARVRWPRVIDPADASDGMSLDLARTLVEHWRDRFDWRSVEAGLNRWRHRTAEIDGVRVHHVHECAVDASGVPVLLVHGWPDSFARYDAMIGELTAAGHDVVVPSLPGFGFSDEPAGPLTVDHMAATVHTLMTGLGYRRYAVHGGDWGSLVAEQIALDNPDAVVALHLTDVPFTHLFALDPTTLSDAEREFVARNEANAAGSVYQAVQSGQPTLLSFGLTDSPVALATWMYDKFRSWSDREPDLDAVLTQVMIYWVTGSIRSSLRPYGEGFGSWDDAGDDDAAQWADASSEPGGWGETADAGGWDGSADAGGWGASKVVAPTAFAIFPADLSVPPQEYAERFFDVARFTLMPRGGHFAAMEEPRLLVEDLLSFLHGRG